MLVRGAVPGTKGGWVLVRDAVKKRAARRMRRKPGAFRKRGAAPDAPQSTEPKEQES